jgi:hypothetical protein
MTAEIVILNKEAVALAADSAVTGQKVFTSANKLFALSKYHPIGIMVYGNAQFMGVPWETIIKIYRKNVSKRKFPTLESHAKHFIKFLDDGNPLFPYSVQVEYLRTAIRAYFSYIRSHIEKEVHSVYDKKGKIDDKEIKEIVSRIIENHFTKWAKENNIPTIPKSFNRSVIEKNSKMLDNTIKEIFEKLPLSQILINKLKKISGDLFSKFPKSVRKEDTSGIVIAGFGDKETFPAVYSYDVEGMVYNKLKFRPHLDGKIDFDNTATIIPFAQGEMVFTFMEGVDPFYNDMTESYFSQLLDKYGEIFVDKIKGYKDSEKDKFKKNMKKVGKEMLREYRRGLKDYRNENYANPVVNVVSMLPKEELAAMAESLVSLTSFKRKVTLDQTVGGPIDVAIISKGDGFIWIKRKHYFKSELNSQFFANYYSEV